MSRKITRGIEPQDELKEIEQNVQAKKIPFVPDSANWLTFGKDESFFGMVDKRPLLTVKPSKKILAVRNVPLDRAKKYYLQVSKDKEQCRLVASETQEGRVPSVASKHVYTIAMAEVKKLEADGVLIFLLDANTLEGKLLENADG